jgi:hypothetical protein
MDAAQSAGGSAGSLNVFFDDADAVQRVRLALDGGSSLGAR